MIDVFGDTKIDTSTSLEELYERVYAVWEFLYGIPVWRESVRSRIHCGVCSSDDWIHRTWHFFEKTDSPSRLRCDVTMKCQFCGHVWPHGVPVPRAEWEDGKARGLGEGSLKHLSRKRAAEYIKRQGERND